MAYRIGNCAQCDAKIMVKDANGRWATQKANRRQLDLTFGNGQRVRVAVCVDCAANPDYKKILEEITSEDSAAFKSEPMKEYVKLLGDVTGHTER